MSRVKELEKLKATAKRMQGEKDKAKGRLEVAQNQMKENFEVDNLVDARKLLDKLAKEETTARETFDNAMETFEDKWGDKLET